MEKSKMAKFSAWVEKVGNGIPNPMLLFISFCIITMLLSHGLYLMGANVILNDEEVFVRSLLTTEGVRHIFSSAVSNFSGFTAMPIVIIAMLGVGVAEGVGLIGTVLKKALLGAPAKVAIVTVVFIGVMSSIASDAGYLVVIPLGGAIFYGLGRNPLAGIAAAFAGVSAGYGANLMVGPVDAILVELTNKAIASVGGDLQLNILANWYFSMASTFLLTLVISLVTIFITEPTLGAYKGDAEKLDSKVTPEENRGLKFALFSLIGVVAFILALSLPAGAPLRDPASGKIIPEVGSSPFMTGIVFIIMLVFIVPAIGYAFGAGVAKKPKDIVPFANKAISEMGGMIALMFFVSQFINYISYTQMGTLLAVNGANAVSNSGINGIPLILVFILLSLVLNMIVPGMTGKWAIFAPIFVPMLMKSGINPALVQAAYRVGDSASNIISPIMSYFVIILAFVQKYDKKAGAGTLIAMMLPYTVFIALAWMVMIAVWYFLGLPLGPGAFVTM